MQSEGVSFRIDDAEVMRYNSGWDMFRPYLFPVVGPSGRHVTRMGHPHDPTTHNHHYSLWVAHHDVEGTDFWSDQPGAGKQVHTNLLALEDGLSSAAMRALVVWTKPDGTEVLSEERTVRLTDLPDSERLIELHMRLAPVGDRVTFGPTSFGLPAVRVAKTICVADGGGQILNSEGGLGEEAVFWKPADWVDTSGPVAEDEWNGLTLMSHPSNRNHAPEWHVRTDGWMGACLSREAALVLERDETLELRYGLYVHRGSPNEADIAGRYATYADSAFQPCER